MPSLVAGSVGASRSANPMFARTLRPAPPVPMSLEESGSTWPNPRVMNYWLHFVRFLSTITWLLLMPAFLMVDAPPAAADDSHPALTFCCAVDNDLYTTLLRSGYRCRRFGTPAKAISKASPNTGVLLLADSYPDKRLVVDAEMLSRAAEKRLRLYVEYPDALPGQTAASPSAAVWERVVVSSTRLGNRLPKDRILMLPGCRFVPLPVGQPLLVLARVAGFDTAVYGLPKSAEPLLVEIPDRHMIVAAAGLSGFLRGRFSPNRDWTLVWQAILERLTPDHSKIHLEPAPKVRPAYQPADRLPKDAERQALRRSARWLRTSGLLLPESRVNEIERALLAGRSSVSMPNRKPAPGDGTHGILEGFSSTIEVDGSQEQLIALRADCCAEAAMVLALDAETSNHPDSGTAARNLLDYTFTTMQSGVRADHRHPAFGLIAWGAVAPAWEVANYGDDNARTILASLVASSSVGSDKWDAPILRALLANLRTTGALGFRGDRIDIPALERNGWRHYYDAQTVNYSPHFEAYLWACNLWAYRHTHYAPFLDRTKTAIRMTMDAYPAGWRWKDSMERARMLLPLAWLVRMEDTAEHRGWLHRIAVDLLKTQQSSGALREQYGGGGGHTRAPLSNEAYGIGEAPLVQREGDPVSDQLYTTGFALLGLHEAAAATGDRSYIDGENKLAEFLCRIQVRSARYPFVDGAWFRAFDDERWDYWGSAADIGWGPWNAETGWGAAWTSATLALRMKRTSVWELTSASRMADRFSSVAGEMAANAGEPYHR